MKNQQQNVKALYAVSQKSSKYEPCKPSLKQQKKRIKKGSDFSKYTNFQRPF